MLTINYYNDFFELGQQKINFSFFELSLPDDDPVYTLKKVMEELDFSGLLAKCSDKGRTGYNPIMMYAVVTYANMRGIRSVDRIVDLCERDLAFIWLTRGQKPRRDAFYDFKSRKLTSDILDDLNYQFMRRLQKEGLVTLKELFIDGTKIEANANRYTFVWRGSINYHLAVETQVELMKNFVADTEDISVAEVYRDSDYSGTNFDRPGFVQMMEDIKHGKINCVIVKDLSRLGRNYVETSNYIERVFPFFHVRFLAVTDDFDSFREGVDLTVPLKNIINEFYSKDLAKKSSSAKKALWKKGKFTSAWEPYGYRKSEEDHHQLIVDEEAAEHLKSIFSMYMDGRNYSDIARQLNKDGVLSPTLQRKFYKTGEKPLPESKPWNNYEVKRVLQDVHCTGDSVFGKSKP